MVVQIKRLRARDAFVQHITDLGVDDILTPAPDDADTSAWLVPPQPVHGRTFANRFAVLPMEGWDATTDGRPTDLVRRRWQRFGASGAGLIWGGEAVAVVPHGRANPRQLCIGPHSAGDLELLRRDVLAHHESTAYGSTPPLIGLQLTHSGRWSKPGAVAMPRTAYQHPLLDARVGADASSVLTDTELDDLVAAFVHAAVVAREAGFDFVDVKHCHGYLLHELLTAHERVGAYGGSLANRMLFVASVIAGIRRDAPGLDVGVRLSAFDAIPHVAGPDGIGVAHPEAHGRYDHAFGGDGTGTGIDLTEPHALCDRLEALDVRWLCVTAGSPYYCPHVQRPAYFPPSDGYLPPRDPLIEVAAMLRTTRELAHRHPGLAVVASGMSYLQEWLPLVGARLVHDGEAAFVGVGRSASSYPELPLDVTTGTTLRRAQLCRTFSDCTTAPRNGLVSGCYPLDEFYKQMPERRTLTAAKRAAETARGSRRRAR